GKTPPCTQAIIESGIKKVICSNRDINRNVKRSGFRILRKHGIEVQTGLMRKQGYRLNEIYFKHISAGKPFITLKAALSLDGYIYSGEFENRYLSGKPFLKFVHHLRAGYDAILIGARTAMVDNPSLNVRLVKGRDPIRIILSDGIPLSSDLNIFNIKSNAPTIVAVSSKADRIEYHKEAVVWTIRSESRNFRLEPLIKRAAREGITSILVEGGGAVYDNFLREKVVDKIILSHTPYLYGSGVPFSSGMGFNELSGVLTFKEFHWEKIGNDSVFTGYPDFWEVD
ncbi:MAG: bifunctional diaminohydroxyphosphoribosylaminopyrimidine deaminase/5-amino-6-(5-phosphoribosylamino)uracil reductase RibD, partial [candidate division Zixibacteria bacterium]|nr:bifunctional diaminohydroxyphosphoribosylaminopyrimidine deaminase/5-amino-6-(5-phosphoribosylamino)uracil reductase RibD [candidate division Zixibacteria bacterium]